MNIEKAVIGYLGPLLPGVTVAGDVPNPRPAKLVTVERTGGGSEQKVLDRPQLALQCWAQTREEASELAYQVDVLMDDIDVNTDIPDMKRTGLYNFPDEKGNPRYQVTFEAVTYRR